MIRGQGEIACGKSGVKILIKDNGPLVWVVNSIILLDAVRFKLRFCYEIKVRIQFLGIALERGC